MLKNYHMKQRLQLFFAFFLLLAYPLYAVINVYCVSMESNILWAGNVFVIFLEVLCHLLEAAIIFFVFSVWIYSVYRWELRASMQILVIHAIGLIYKYGINLLIAYLFDGFPSKGTVFADDLFTVGMNILLELLEFGIVILITWLVIDRYKQKVGKEQTYARHIPGYTSSDRYQVFPYKKILDRSNPILACILYISLVNLAMRLISLVLGEISLSILGGWIPETPTEWIYIIIEILYECVIAVGGYFYMRKLIHLINNRLCSTEK